MKHTERIISAAMAAIIGISSFSATVSAKWIPTGTSYAYLNTDTNEFLTGWQKIGGYYYYFDDDGNALLGWQKINGHTRFFSKSRKGRMVTGWVDIGSSRYYFGKDGVMRTSWQNIGGYIYYFGSNGKMRTGRRSIDGHAYDFGTSGRLRPESIAVGDTENIEIPKVKEPFPYKSEGVTGHYIFNPFENDKYIPDNIQPYQFYQHLDLIEAEGGFYLTLSFRDVPVIYKAFISLDTYKKDTLSFEYTDDNGVTKKHTLSLVPGKRRIEYLVLDEDTDIYFQYADHEYRFE